METKKTHNNIIILFVCLILSCILVFGGKKAYEMYHLQQLLSLENAKASMVVFNTNVGKAFTDIQEKIKEEQDGSTGSLNKISALFATQAYLQDISPKNEKLFLEFTKTNKWKEFVKNNYKNYSICSDEIRYFDVSKDMRLFCINTLWNNYLSDEKNAGLFIEKHNITQEDYNNIFRFISRVKDYGDTKAIWQMIDFYIETVFTPKDALTVEDFI